MRTFAGILLICTAMLAAPVTKDKPDSVDAQLQGEWVAVECEEKGEPATVDDLKREVRRAIIAEGTIRISDAGDELESYKFAIRRPEGGGNRYDFDFHQGGEKRNHALIELHDKDAFTLVVHSRFQPNRPQDRPTDLTSKNNEVRDPDGLWNPLLFKFKRVPKGRKPADLIEEHHKAKAKK